MAYKTFEIINNGVMIKEDHVHWELTFDRSDRVMQLHHYQRDGVCLLKIHSTCDGEPYTTPFSLFSTSLFQHLVGIARHFGITLTIFKHGESRCRCLRSIRCKRRPISEREDLRKQAMKNVKAEWTQAERPNTRSTRRK